MLEEKLKSLEIDLSGLEIGEIETFLQDGSKGVPEFAASCSGLCRWCCVASCNACAVDQPKN